MTILALEQKIHMITLKVFKIYKYLSTGKNNKRQELVLVQMSQLKTMADGAIPLIPLRSASFW